MKYDSFFTEDGYPNESRFGKNIFYLLYKNRLEGISREIESGGEVPSLLLHSCCGPCSSAVITKLSPFFNITVFYYNPNIDSLEEYRKRADNQKKFLDFFSKNNNGFNHSVSYIEEDYDSLPFYAMCGGLENEAEGGKRCVECFKLRLNKTAATAAKLGFHFFSSTLTVSPMKDTRTVNLAGMEAADKTGCEWLWSDFKKENGYLLSIKLSKNASLYRQQYCGCIYSKQRLNKRD